MKWMKEHPVWTLVIGILLGTFLLGPIVVWAFSLVLGEAGTLYARLRGSPSPTAAATQVSFDANTGVPQGAVS